MEFVYSVYTETMGQHLHRDRGIGPTICGETGEPASTITLAQFAEELGRATGRDTKFFVDEDLLCTLCATRLIAEETESQQ